MNLLLDTHVVLWALTDDPALSPGARAAIVDGKNRVVVSAVTAWEVAIKRSLGKLRAPDDLEHQVRAHRFEALDITFAHANEVGRLPAVHRDPFDRLLVAQAHVEGLTIVTRDPHIPDYGVPTLPA